jgi:hypothetical protein
MDIWAGDLVPKRKPRPFSLPLFTEVRGRASYLASRCSASRRLTPNASRVREKGRSITLSYPGLLVG